jgi:hypothetical protein
MSLGSFCLKPLELECNYISLVIKIEYASPGTVARILNQLPPPVTNKLTFAPRQNYINLARLLI